MYTLWYHSPNEFSDFSIDTFKRVCDIQSIDDVKTLFEYFNEDWFQKGFYMLVQSDRSPVISDNTDCNRISFVAFLENKRTGIHCAFKVWKELVIGLVEGTLLSNQLRTPETNAVVVKSTPKASGKVTFNIWLPSKAVYMDPREAISSEFHTAVCKNIHAYNGQFYRDQRVGRQH